MLDEFDYAIKHFVPTLPEEIKKEAQDTLAKLSADEQVDEAAIRKAFYTIGVKEYPYRRAYEELTHTSAESQIKMMVLDHVNEKVRSVIRPHLDSGVHLDELMKSQVLIDELTPEEIYQIEDGIAVAESKLADEIKGEGGDHSTAYKELYGKWVNTAKEIQEKIDKLEALAQGGTENQQLEIKNKATRYREGFIVTEQDPDLEEIKKEIEYWQDTFAEE